MYPGMPVPNANSGKVDEAEQLVFDKLREALPDDWVVLHSVRENMGKINYEADFIVLIPEMGVLVLEVKSHKKLRVKDGIWYEFHKEENCECPMEHNSPLEQAFFNSLKFIQCRKLDDSLEEWNAGDERKWTEHIRYTCAAILTSREEIPDGGDQLKNERASKALFSVRQRYICGISELNMKQLPELFLSYFGKKKSNKTGKLEDWRSPWFSNEVIRAIREKVKPSRDFRIDPAIYRFCLRKAAARASQLLEATAESYADVTVRGCAGSGKTVMLRKEALRLYYEAKERGIPRHILVLCFNNALAVELKGYLRECERKGEQTVQVYSFHAFAEQELERLTGGYKLQQKLNKCKNEAEKSEVWKRVGIDLRDMIFTAENPRHFDHIFIDEAQDFEPAWFSCLSLYTRSNIKLGHKRGRLYYFCDSNQKLREDAAGMSSTPIQMRLKHNLRNARQIAQFNSRSLTHVEEMDRPIAMDFAYGRDIELMEEGDVEERRRCLKDLINRLTERERVNANDIVVLSPYKKGNPKNSFGDIDKKVRKACTIRAFKGLEADYVILTDIAPQAIENDVQSYQDFYVAASRAKYALYIIPAKGGLELLSSWKKEAEALEDKARSNQGLFDEDNEILE